jgi:hypothetical protein
MAAIEADDGPASPPPALRDATDTPDTAPRKDLLGLTSSEIEAIVYARLPVWAPPPGSALEHAETAAVVGYAPGLGSQVSREE